MTVITHHLQGKCESWKPPLSTNFKVYTSVVLDSRDG